jgi:sortase A
LPATGRKDAWDRPAAPGIAGESGRAEAARWETVLPPVSDAPDPRDRTGDRTAAGVDEATTFMSQWGPPPLAVPRSNDQERADRAWGPSAPSRAGAGGTAANPPDGAAPGWTRTPPVDPAAGARRPADAADRPVPGAAAAAAFGRATTRDPADPTERSAGDRVADHPDRRPPAGDTAADRSASPRSGGEANRDGRSVGGGADGDGRSAGADRRGWDAPEQAPETDETYQEDPTEVIGPFDIGAWSLQGRDGAAVLDRRRPRGQSQDTRGQDTRGQDARGQDARPEPARERAADRVRVGVGGGGGDSDEPPTGGDGGNGDDPHRDSSDDRIRTLIRGIGQTFLTLGVILLLLVGYEVWFTDLVNHRTQHRLTTTLEQQWEDGDDPTVATAPAKPGEKIASLPIGDGFALIYMPDFGTDYVYTVVEGTGVDELNDGPGHYVGTPLPGAVGNVAIAGHRVGKGSPFLNLDKLKAGSAIVIRTKSYWYTYRVLGDTGTGDPSATTSLGIPGREIVDPSDVDVIAPVPDQPGAAPTRRMLTLTTCHPKFSARQRLVIHAILDGAPYPVSKGTPPSMTGK